MAGMSQDQFNKDYSRIVAKAWADPKFKEALQKNPMEILTKEGIQIPKGMNIKVVSSTEHEKYLVIPSKPTGELDEEALSNIAAGDSCSCAPSW